MKRLVQFTAVFSGSVEVDADEYDSDWTADDILATMTHEQLFAACETDLDLTVDFEEEVAE